MASKPSAMKMPELLVFARMLFIGFVGAEVARIFFLLGTRESANKQVISSQAGSLIKISRIRADCSPVNTSN